MAGNPPRRLMTGGLHEPLDVAEVVCSWIELLATVTTRSQ